MLFHEKLKMLRKGNNFTQEELAEKLNVSRQAITKWESGDGIPDIENLKQISSLFQTTIDELVKEEKNISLEKKKQYELIKEFEIDHTKHFDIHLDKLYELILQPSEEEKIKIEVCSNEEELLEESIKIKFDDLYDKLDIGIKNKKRVQDLVVNLYLPQKYIEEIELNAKMKTLHISNLDLHHLEYDGTLKYLDVQKSKGKIVLNTTKCDVEAKYDKLEGALEVNIIHSTARVEIPKDAKYQTILKGMKNEFIDAIHTEDAPNTIELNGIGSKLMVIAY